MWLFDLFKRRKLDNTELSKQFINYLNKVDKEYMRAYSIKSTKQLQIYVSRDCTVKLANSIFSISSRYFGSDKLRHTTWTKVQENSEIVKILKDVVFEKVRIRGNVEITKVDSKDKDKKIEGAVFGLYDQDNNLIEMSNKEQPIVLDISKI